MQINRHIFQAQLCVPSCLHRLWSPESDGSVSLEEEVDPRWVGSEWRVQGWEELGVGTLGGNVCVCREGVEMSEKKLGNCVAFYTHTHTDMHIYTRTHMHLCMHMNAQACRHTHACTHTCICLYMNAHICTHACTHIHLNENMDLLNPEGSSINGSHPMGKLSPSCLSGWA